MSRYSLAILGVISAASLAVPVLAKYASLSSPSMTILPHGQSPFVVSQQRYSVDGCMLRTNGTYLVRRIVPLEEGGMLYIDEKGTAKAFTGGAYEVAGNTVTQHTIDSGNLFDEGPDGDVARIGLEAIKACDRVFPDI